MGIGDWLWRLLGSDGSQVTLTALPLGFVRVGLRWWQGRIDDFEVSLSWDEEPPSSLPGCLGARLGSTQPCALWRVRRRR